MGPLAQRVHSYEGRGMLLFLSYAPLSHGSLDSSLPHRLLRYASLKHSFIQAPLSHVTHARVMAPQAFVPRLHLNAAEKFKQQLQSEEAKRGIAFAIEGEVTADDWTPRVDQVAGASSMPGMDDLLATPRKSQAWAKTTGSLPVTARTPAFAAAAKEGPPQHQGPSPSSSRSSRISASAEGKAPYLSPSAAPLITEASPQQPTPDIEDEQLWSYNIGYSGEIFSRAFVRRKRQEQRWQAAPVQVSATPWVIAEDDKSSSSSNQTGDRAQPANLQHNGYMVKLSWDFDLAGYFSSALGSDLDHIVETTPLTWLLILAVVAIMEPLVFLESLQGFPLAGIGTMVVGTGMCVFSAVVLRKLSVLARQLSSNGLHIAAQQARLRLMKGATLRSCKLP